MTTPGTRALRAVAAAVGLAACSGSAANHETLGDRAYAARRFGDALVEYRIALQQRAPNAALRVKAGAAALHVNELQEAAEQFVALAREGGDDRRAEAADGLARVAQEAVTVRDQEALAAALAGLQEVAPGRAGGTLAHQLVRTVGSVPRTAEALPLLVSAAATAPDARTQDSLIYAYGVLLRRLGRCEDAVPVFEALARRQREPAILREAREGVGLCALMLGRQALNAGRPSEGEDWFRRAAQGGGDTPSARAAYVGLGDVQLARGDYQAAAEAYFRAMAGAARGDSIAAVAAERLNALGRAETPVP